MKTRILSTLVFVLTLASVATAAPVPNPGPAVCKADLKVWSASKIETLTIEQIMSRMEVMVACADKEHHHNDKKMRGYLDEFYRAHTELANRAFDFIESHDLKAQFYEEKNGSVPEANAEAK